MTISARYIVLLLLSDNKVVFISLLLVIIVVELRLLYSVHLVIIGAVEAHIVTPVKLEYQYTASI